MAARILIIDDEDDVRNSIRRVLEPAGHAVLESAEGIDGLRIWGRESLDLVLVDVSLPDIDGYEVVTRIRSTEVPSGHVPVILLGVSNAIEERLRGLRVGADDYLVKPVNPLELVARTRSLLARSAPRAEPAAAAVAEAPSGSILVFYGAKGGVGTTTLAINAAIGLCRDLHRSVVLVDGNLQFGDHRVFLDLGIGSRSIVDAVQASAIDQDLLRSVLVHHKSGIDLLLAPPSPEMAELVSEEARHMAQILDHLRRMYDYVVVDIDQRLDETNLDIIALADVVFVVLSADLSSLKNVRLMLETMSQLGLPPEKVRLVLNRSTAFTGISVKNAEGALARPIDYTIVNDYRVAMSALNSGSPLMLTHSDSPVGKSTLAFVRAVDAAEQEERAAQVKTP